MKLADFTNVSVLQEGHVEPNSLLALQHVAERGRITNTFELLVLCKFAQLVKSGKIWSEGNPLFTDAVTVTTEMTRAVKALNAQDLHTFATYIFNVVSGKNDGSSMIGANTPFVDWLKLYTAREATD